MKKQQNKPPLKKWPILVLSSILFTLIILGGYFYYRHEKKIISQEKHNNLKSIADLKTSQIVYWRAERLADADVFAETFIRQKFQQWLYSQDSALEKEFLERFSLLRYYYKYEDVMIVSAGGKLLLGLDTNLIHIDSEIIDNCKKALREKKSFLGDFYFSPADHTIHFDVFAPILSDKNVPVAVLVLRVDPFDFLYPLFQSWPTPSKSAETLIIRKDGDSVLYVNDLRHIPNTALKLRIPLTRVEVPAVQAVLGSTGIFEGLDYRGVSVLAEMRPVPGSPWYMIAKVDQSEIFSELTYRTVFILIITLLLLLFSGIGLSWFYNNRQMHIYRKLLEAGTALAESQVEFRTTLYSIGDAVITTDMKGCIRNMNAVAEKLTGWKESDGVGKNIGEVFHIVNEESGNKVESPVQRVLKEGLVVKLANHTLLISKDGKKIPIADSGAPICNDKGDITGVVLVFRDQTREHEAQKALQHSEEKFSLAFKTSPYAITITNPENGRFIEVNDAFFSTVGYTREEALQNSSIGMHLWVDLEDRNQVVKALLDGKKVAGKEYRFKKKTGEIITGLYSAHLIDIKNKTYILSSISDITERKRAEEVLRRSEKDLEQLVADRSADLKRSEEKFRTVADFAYNWEYWTDSDNRMLYVSPSCERITGFPPDSFYENPGFIETIVHPDDRQTYETHIESFHSGKDKGEKCEQEFRIIDKTGCIKWIGHLCTPVFGDNGAYLGRRASNRDITESKKAETLLRCQKDIGIILNYKIPLREAFDSVLEAAIEVSGMDCGGVYLLDDASGAIDLVHYKGLPADFVAVSSHYSADSPNNQLVMKGEPVYTSMPALNVDKHEPEQLHAIAIIPMLALGKVIGCMNVASHIVESVPADVRNGLEVLTFQASAALARIKAENEIAELNESLKERSSKLEASNKELEAFSYSVSHDLRAPLRHVNGYVELLNKLFQTDLPEKGRHYLNSISDSVRIMGMLIDDLLQFSRTGRTEMHLSVCDMNEIVKEVKESLAKDPDREIEWTVGKLTSIHGDEAMLRLVWVNLLSNAVKFTSTRKKARIEIGFRKENKELVFYVRDNGVGFDMQYAQKLFGVFQRLHSSEKFEGTGIGLANVHRIVLRHGGRTWAEAEPDKGAAFFFTIPEMKQTGI